MSYKNNHTIPKGLLKNWSSSKSGRSGVYVYEIEKDKQYFSTGEGKGAFSFASENYLFIPEIDGTRLHNLEKWKGSLESDLSIFIRKIINKEIDGIVNNRDQLTKLILALLSLNISQYDLENGEKFLCQNPDIKKNISAKPDREIKFLLLENIVNLATENTNNYFPLELRIFHTKPDEEFLLCDRPFIETPFDSFSFIPLTKNILLAFGRNPNLLLDYTIKYFDCDSLLVSSINEIIVERSRKWLISSNEILLNNYKGIIGSERWLQSKENDKVECVPLKNINSGVLY